MTAPTPGPWRAERTNPAGDVLIETLRETVPPFTYPSRILATVWSHEQEEYEANARLIAAAPELLEALRAALPELRGEDMNHEVYNAAKAAVAKAEHR